MWGYLTGGWGSQLDFKHSKPWMRELSHIPILLISIHNIFTILHWQNEVAVSKWSMLNHILLMADDVFLMILPPLLVVKPPQTSHIS